MIDHCCALRDALVENLLLAQTSEFVEERITQYHWILAEFLKDYACIDASRISALRNLAIGNNYTFIPAHTNPRKLKKEEKD